MICHRGTPVEEWDGILVKREDLCSPLPGPSFSKIRGVEARIRNRPEQTIGVLDTYHSKAGWAVAYVCSELGKEAVVYWPKRKSDPGHGAPIRESQLNARELGALVMPLQAGRSAVLYHGAKRDLAAYGRAVGSATYMMPNALKLDESVDETAEEVRSTELPGGMKSVGTVVISVSSGTIAAGVVRGIVDCLARPDIVLHLGYSRPERIVRSYVSKAAEVPLSIFPSVRVIDQGYTYGASALGEAPFPCNPYYDLKAWTWTLDARAELRHPVLFWNVGA